MRDHHVDRPEVEAQRCVQPTGPNRSTELLRPPPQPQGRSAPEGRRRKQTAEDRRQTCSKDAARCLPASAPCPSRSQSVVLSSVMLYSVLCLADLVARRRGCPTRPHPELGRETLQRPWYCTPRCGRVGRRQVRQAEARRQKTENRRQKTKQLATTPPTDTPLSSVILSSAF